MKEHVVSSEEVQRGRPAERNHSVDRWSVFMLNQTENLSSVTLSSINPLSCYLTQMLTNLHFTVMADD